LRGEARVNSKISKFAKALPEVEKLVRLHKFGRTVQHGTKVFEEKYLIWADTSFFDVFTYKFVIGDPTTALVQPNSVVLTQSSAQKYFGNDDCMGKSLVFKDRYWDGELESQSYQVTGIIENPPPNNSFPFSMICSITPYETESAFFVLLREGASVENVGEKLSQSANKLRGWEEESLEKLRKAGKHGFSLQTITDVHLYSDFGKEYLSDGYGNLQQLRSLICLVVLIIFIACINYMNLATAKSAIRAKEIGVRKVVGCSRYQLIVQHLTESVLHALMSLGFAVALTEMLLPAFSSLVGKPIAFHYFSEWYVVPGLLGFALFVGFLAGSYPAFYLTVLQPVKVLKSASNLRRKGNGIRKGLIVFQFVAAIALMIYTAFVFRQMHYILNRELGVNKERVLVVHNMKLLGSLEPFEVGEQQQTFKTEVLSQACVINAAFVNPVLSGAKYPSNFYLKAAEAREERAEDKHFIYRYMVDHDFIPTLQIEIVSGRNFSPRLRTDATGVLINEMCAQALGGENAVGQHVYVVRPKVKWVEETGAEWTYKVVEYTIVGVMKNYHYTSLYDEIKPVMVFTPYGFPGYIGGLRHLLVRIAEGDLQTAVNKIENIWKEFQPEFPMTYTFLDQRFDAAYRDDIRFGKIVGTFTGLTIFIACLGIFGLIAFTAERRTKEIGIRKTLGASVSNIIILLTNETTRWVLISCVIAVPIGYLAVNRWLQNFAYRIDLNVTVFILSCLMAFVIALLTVSSQAFRAARANPVDSLRYE
jgi:putative ABC transport system permease protein